MWVQLPVNDRGVVEIDGSVGEGGGQMLRSALALSMMTGRPLRMKNIRAKRRKPGLLRQHLACVQAATQICSAQVHGATLGSLELEFVPGPIRGGDYHVAIGTAGSTMLVLQAVLPALLAAPEPSTLQLSGGTHNPMAPPFDFVERAFVGVLKRMGAEIEMYLERPGFYPAGGGSVSVAIDPKELRPLELLQRGELRGRRACALVAGGIPEHVAERELGTIRRRMGWSSSELHIEVCDHSVGPGNALTLELQCDHITEVFSGCGEAGVAAERVARGVIKETNQYLKRDVPVGQYLADQLLLPFVLAGGGSFRTSPPTQHTLTNIEVIQAFVATEIELVMDNQRNVNVEIRWTN